MAPRPCGPAGWWGCGGIWKQHADASQLITALMRHDGQMTDSHAGSGGHMLQSCLVAVRPLKVIGMLCCTKACGLGFNTPLLDSPAGAGVLC